MVAPVQALLGEALYMQQFKINGKMAFKGDVWQWHQDYGTWMNDDLMPTQRAMNVAIFLDDVNEFNGPLMFIHGSHRKGVIEAKHDLTTTSYPLWTVDNDLIAQLVQRAGGKQGGIVSPKGPAGERAGHLERTICRHLRKPHEVKPVPMPMVACGPLQTFAVARACTAPAPRRPGTAGTRLRECPPPWAAPGAPP